MTRPSLAIVMAICSACSACPRKRPTAQPTAAIPATTRATITNESASTNRPATAAQPMFRGDIGRRGQTPFAITRTTPRVVFRHETGQPIFGSPAVDPQGHLYVGSLDGTVLALTRTGQLRWQHPLQRIFASPAVTAASVLVGSDDDYLVSLDRIAGTTQWRFRLGPCETGPGLGPDTVRCDADSSPLVAPDGAIFIGGDALYALTPAGKLRWRAELGGHAFSSPTMGPDGTLFIGTQANTVVAIGPDGSRRWESRTQGDVDATAALADPSTLVVGADDGLIYCLAPADGATRWTHNTHRPVRSSAAVYRDTALVGSDSGELWALALQDGAVRWRHETGGPVRSSPTVDPDGVVVFGSQDGALRALDREGKVLWTVVLGAQIDSSVAVASDGTLWVGADDGTLYGLR